MLTLLAWVKRAMNNIVAGHSSCQRLQYRTRGLHRITIVEKMRIARQRLYHIINRHGLPENSEASQERTIPILDA